MLICICCKRDVDGINGWELCKDCTAYQQETFYGQLVGQVIRGCREMQGIKLLAMAQSLDLSSASGWSRVETGDTTMTLAQLRKAAKKLGMSPGAIVQRADAIAAQLELSGVVVRDDKPKDIGKRLLGGAGILAVVAAAGAAATAAKTSRSRNISNIEDGTCRSAPTTVSLSATPPPTADSSVIPIKKPKKRVP